MSPSGASTFPCPPRPCFHNGPALPVPPRLACRPVPVTAAFVQAARPYGERKGISYAAWREAGVDAAVLKRAGVRRAAGDA